ncbi:MAG: hypothetical protein MZU95_15575 [Desulfomicrobium escambiense]|nr:hypothetical protein [Desulfomicrobium escambiense]
MPSRREYPRLPRTGTSRTRTSSWGPWRTRDTGCCMRPWRRPSNPTGNGAASKARSAPWAGPTCPSRSPGRPSTA